MKIAIKSYVFRSFFALLIATELFCQNAKEINEMELKDIKLPKPRIKSSISIEETLNKRRSVREYANAPLAMEEISQILWAAQGITDDMGKRTAPSAGALYPLEIYMAVANVEGITPGLYKYLPRTHSLTLISKGDKREDISASALSQNSLKNCSVIIIFTAIYERVTIKYGERGVRYTHIEVGHSSQNVFLQAAALNLKTVVIGAFNDNKLKKTLNISEEPLYLMPVGK